MLLVTQHAGRRSRLTPPRATARVAAIALFLCKNAGSARATVFVSDTPTTYNSTFLKVGAWHAQALANISWNSRTAVAGRGTGGSSSRPVDRLDRIVIYWDQLQTDFARFGNGSSGIAVPSSSFSSLPEHDYVIFQQNMGNGSNICSYTAYESDASHPFDNRALSGEVTVELDDGSAWWYTSTLAQTAPPSASTSSREGSASVLLSDPGSYIACLVPGGANCIAADCVDFKVYQPLQDILEVMSTNVGAVVTVRFNVASFDATLGDWGWVLGGVNSSFGVDDANLLESSEVYSQFQEGCWFYLGRATELGHAFVCSRDPNEELASLQASTADRVYQYGWFQMYSAAAGNVSIWYAVDEDYDFAMVHNYYTCGIDVRPPASLVANTTSEVIIVGELVRGENCRFGDGVPLRIHTNEVVMQYVDVSSSIYFWGQMDNMTSTETTLSIRLPVTGTHEIMVELESGAQLATLHVAAVPAKPYAPACKVESTFPTSFKVHALANLSFASRDFYNNDIAIGYGDDAFEAWVIQPGVSETREVVRDVGNGTYAMQHVYDEIGTTLLFIQRDGLNIPGSPFETYVFGPDQCVIESLDIRVDDCGSNLYRRVVHDWKEDAMCEGGLTLPNDTKFPCSYVPVASTLGRTMVVVSAFAAIYSAFYLVWIMRHRTCMIVKLGQPFVCKLFLVGCILLNLTAPLHLGKPTALACMARPVLVHTALTFTCSCLYMKTFRVHRLFNSPHLVRMSISDRSLVIWVLRLVAVDVALLTLWMILDRPRLVMNVDTYGYADVLSPVCSSGANYLRTILWVYKGGLNAFGVVMAAKTWNCADGVGESQSICLSVYNTTLLGLVNLVLHLLRDDQLVTLGAQAFTEIWGTVFTVSVVFAPKAYQLHYHGDLRAGPASHRLSGCSTRKDESTTTRRGSGVVLQQTLSTSRQSLRSKPSWRRPSLYKKRQGSRINPMAVDGDRPSPATSSQRRDLGMLLPPLPSAGSARVGDGSGCYSKGKAGR